jgi:hypothetical protein
MDHGALTKIFTADRVFLRVYRLPEKLTNGYCFGGGVPIAFTNVDWFEAFVEDGREKLVQFIRGKQYYRRDARFLVLGDRPDFVFTIDPEASHG